MPDKAAIIGGGVIGGGWAARFLLGGWNVSLYDPDLDARRKIADILTNARYALPMLYDTALPPEGTLTHCDTIAAAVANADWIQESVPERLDLKHDVLARIEAHAPRDTIIASSTSGFKPSHLARGMANTERLIVAHPFNPVYLLPLVEVVGSPETSDTAIAYALQVLTALGMFTLHVRAEIDAHIADRFLEAVWREALWLVRDGIATTEEIDNAIRYGFGLRWAQMGLFETYRVAGGEAGMKHFIEQFGPCLTLPWTRLMDVPELTDDLVNTITAQSDAQSGAHTIGELERMRDANLVAILRALKVRDAGAGALLNQHEARIRPALVKSVGATAKSAEAIISVARTVPIDWTDYNGHMNESRYGQVFSDAADHMMARVGADLAYVAAGHSFFAVDIHIRFLAEARAAQPFTVASRVLEGRGKKLRLYHEMLAQDGTPIATAVQLLLHVSLSTRRACAPLPKVSAAMQALAAAHAHLARPEHTGDG